MSLGRAPGALPKPFAVPNEGNTLLARPALPQLFTSYKRGLNGRIDPSAFIETMRRLAQFPSPTIDGLISRRV
jgi:hypothetical protein